MFNALGEASGGSGGSPMVCLPRHLEASLRDVVPATAAAYDGRASLCVVLERYEGTSETVLGVSVLDTPYSETLTANQRRQL